MTEIKRTSYKGLEIERSLNYAKRCGPELESKGYSGCFSTSYFSAYLIELNNNCDMARVTYSIC